MNEKPNYKRVLSAPSAALLIALISGPAFGDKGEDRTNATKVAQELGGRGAIVIYDGVTYALPIFGSCGSGSDDGYNTWAATLDDEGTPSSDGPRLHAYSSGTWSRFEFNVGGPQPDVNLYHDGDNIVRFSDGTLTYDGPVAEGSSETISIDISCG